jgi:serine/threonine protein kinase
LIFIFFHFRSIKPENFMATVLPDDSAPRITLIDFGLAALEDVGCRTDAAGSVDFAAPETLRLNNDVSFSYDAILADAWSLGIVLYLLPTWRYFRPVLVCFPVESASFDS